MRLKQRWFQSWKKLLWLRFLSSTQQPYFLFNIFLNCRHKKLCNCWRRRKNLIRNYDLIILVRIIRILILKEKNKVNVCDLGLFATMWQTELHLWTRGGAALRSMALSLLVLSPVPVHACNAVCNEKSKQRTAVRHDRNVFPLAGDPCKKTEERRIIRRGRDESRRRTHLGQSGRLMLLYICCHSASPPSPIGPWSSYQLLPPPLFPLSPTASPYSVCSGGQWHSLEGAPVTPASSSWLCHQLWVCSRISNQVPPGWERAGSWATNTRR